MHPWHVGLFPPQAQQEVWGRRPGDPDLVVVCTDRQGPAWSTAGTRSAAGGASPPAAITPPGSCSARSSPTIDNRPIDFRTFLLPRADYAIDDVWDTVGLRGTGSNDIVVDDVFVPEHRSLSFVDVSKLVVPGQELNPAPLYRLPYGSVFSYSITTPIIGMATGAYEAHVTYTRERVRVAYVGQKAAQDPFAQVRVAEAAAEIDDAWLRAGAQHDRADGVRASGPARSPSSCGCGCGATRSAGPASRSGRSTSCSRIPAAGR